MIMIIPALFAALIGILVGAFLNALADDLPHSNQIRRPHYPDGAPRPLRAWVALAAFLSGAQTSPDGARLSWRQPLTELVTAALFLVITLDGANAEQPARALWLMILSAFLVLITVIDLEHRIILVLVIALASAVALIGAWVLLPWARVPFNDHLLGGALGFGVFLLLYLGGVGFSAVMASVRGELLEEVAFGYGDVLLAMLSGFILGWQALIFAATIAVFLGGAGAILYMAARLVLRGRYEAFTALPYGQYIVIGTLIMMLWRTPVIQVLQGG
ncbi:MAG: prepilin peptidase [Anaerolineales bacterium]|nr:prepilin peptidase [Anaerolineales bacterium]